MSIACVQNYLRGQFPAFLTEMQNGECRLLSLQDETATDEFGFISSGYEARTDEFLPCVWKERAVKEQEVALQSRGVNVFEINIPVLADGTSVAADPSDRIELKANFTGAGAETILLEVVALANKSAIYHHALAMRVKQIEE